MDITKELATFAYGLKVEDIPSETSDFIKGLALKTVAGMVVGSHMPTGKKVVGWINGKKSSEEVGVIGCGLKASIQEAVLAQGIFAHASELEDDRFKAGTAWDITTFPLTFPLAEKLGLSGGKLLEISAVGLEVHSRTCLFYPQGFMGLTVIPGAIGPAVSAARAFGLDVAETMAAMGLAMSSAPVAYVNFGTDSHYFESAMHGLQALLAVEFSKEGLSSNPDIVTYISNLVGKENVTPEEMVSNLGAQWLVHDIWVKKYPCCFYTHRHIDSLLEIMREENLTHDQISTIKVHIQPAAAVCNRPEPKTIGDIQFSFQHILASAMIDGDVNYKHIAVETALELEFKEAAKKVEVILHEDWVTRYPMEKPIRIEVCTTNGQTFSKERAFAIGAPEEPLPMEDFKGLFTKFTEGIFSEEKCSWLADAIADMENLTIKDMEQLFKVLVFESGS
jgi:2-methylcitrate dehydratase PrpD